MNVKFKNYPRLLKLCSQYDGNETNNFYKEVIKHLSTNQEQLIEIESNLKLLDSNNFDLFLEEILPQGNKLKDRGFERLTNRFNELKGFLYLKENKFKNIRFISRAEKNGQQTPDLLATEKNKNDTIMEVITINNSDDEIELLQGRNNVAGNVLDSIPTEMVNQIKKGILEKKNQIDSYNSKTKNKIILMVIKLDISCSITDAPILHLQEIMIGLAKETISYKIVWLIEGFDKKRIEKLNLSGFQEFKN